MNRTVALLGAGFLTAFTVTACSANVASPEGSVSSTVVETGGFFDTQVGTPITVAVGDTFTINHTPEPDTGITYSVDTAVMENSWALTIDKDASTPDAGVLVFKAQEAGEARLSIASATRDEETGKAVLATDYTVYNVTVTP